jgi:opacity protein-like surface antigen
MTGLERLATADLSLVLADASLRFDLTGPRTWHRIQPYVVIGAGGVFVTSYAETGEEDLPENLELRVRFQKGFTGHVGGGLEIHVSDHLTVRVDARDTLWKLQLPIDFLTTGRVIDNEQWVQTAHLGLGLNFRF